MKEENKNHFLFDVSIMVFFVWMQEIECNMKRRTENELENEKKKWTRNTHSKMPSPYSMNIPTHIWSSSEEKITYLVALHFQNYTFR